MHHFKVLYLKLTLTWCLTAVRTLNLVTSCKSLKINHLSDDPEEKSGFKKACSFINEELSPYLKDVELPLNKKIFEGVSNWVERRKIRSPRSANE